jgi:hypothetical protein
MPSCGRVVVLAVPLADEQPEPYAVPALHQLGQPVADGP